MEQKEFNWFKGNSGYFEKKLWSPDAWNKYHNKKYTVDERKTKEVWYVFSKTVQLDDDWYFQRETYTDPAANQRQSIKSFKQDVDNISGDIRVDSPECVAFTDPTGEVGQSVSHIPTLQSFVRSVESTITRQGEDC